jgi:hypothetical protein
MANFTDDKILTVWQNAKIVENLDATVWRKDACDAWINWNEFGKESAYGWEIDHVLPVCKNGTDNTINLRAMHWKNNRCKSDDFPSYYSAITSEGHKNVEKKESKTINNEKLNELKRLYPNNPYVKNLS